MITNINEFRQHLKKILDGYQMDPKDSIDILSKDKMRNLATSSIGNRINNVPTTDNPSKTVPKLKQMPGFYRVLSDDPNPKFIGDIPVDRLDITYELPLEGIPVYSHESDTMVKGSALYYGWSVGNDRTESDFFFVALTTKNEDGKIKDIYNSNKNISKSEMYDIIWQLLDLIDDVHSQTLDSIDPKGMTNDRLSNGSPGINF